MQFFIKRGDKTQGPISHQQLLEFVRAKKIVATDLVSNSADGPFHELKTVWDRIKQTPQATQQSATQQPATQPGAPTPPVPSVPVQSTPEVPAVSSGPNWILIGGISGGAILLLVVIIVVIAMNSGNGRNDNIDVASTSGNSSNSADNSSNSVTSSSSTTGTANKKETESETNVKTYDTSTPQKFALAVFDTLKNDDLASFMAIASISDDDHQYSYDRLLAIRPE